MSLSPIPKPKQTNKKQKSNSKISQILIMTNINCLGQILNVHVFTINMKIMITIKSALNSISQLTMMVHIVTPTWAI